MQIVKQIVDSKKAFKYVGIALQLSFDGDKFLWTHNRWESEVGLGKIISHLADAKAHSDFFNKLSSAYFTLVLTNFSGSAKQALYKKEHGIDVEFNINETYVKEKDIIYFEGTGYDPKGKPLPQVAKDLLTMMGKEDKINPPTKTTFLQRLNQINNTRYKYVFDDNLFLEKVEHLPESVVGQGMYVFYNNTLFMVNERPIAFEKSKIKDLNIPELDTNFGNILTGNRIEYICKQEFKKICKEKYNQPK